MAKLGMMLPIYFASLGEILRCVPIHIPYDHYLGSHGCWVLKRKMCVCVCVLQNLTSMQLCTNSVRAMNKHICENAMQKNNSNQHG